MYLSFIRLLNNVRDAMLQQKEHQQMIKGRVIIKDQKWDLCVLFYLPSKSFTRIIEQPLHCQWQIEIPAALFFRMSILEHDFGEIANQKYPHWNEWKYMV